MTLAASPSRKQSHSRYMPAEIWDDGESGECSDTVFGIFGRRVLTTKGELGSHQLVPSPPEFAFKLSNLCSV